MYQKQRVLTHMLEQGVKEAGSDGPFICEVMNPRNDVAKSKK
jgi:hypothetical protein